MPSRWLREGILTSERVDKLSPHAEVLYRRLMSVVDDYGRYYASPALVRAVCYPLAVDRVREADILRLLAEVQDAHLIVRYTVHGKHYLEMLDTNWLKRSKPKFPSQNGEDVQSDMKSQVSDDGTECAQHARRLRAVAPVVEVVVGNEIEIEGAKKNVAFGDFDRWWLVYPKKSGKEAARKAYGAAIKRLKADGQTAKIAQQTLLKTVTCYADSPKAKSQYCWNPATWLNQGHWEDDPMVWQRGDDQKDHCDGIKKSDLDFAGMDDGRGGKL